MYNRISIVGGSGSGKTTLADTLSKIYNIPAIHIDGINYLSNWESRDKSERDNIILSCAKENKWIIDGNYSATLRQRFERADLIIWLDYSTFAQLRGVFKRVLKNLNKEKTEIPGCKEKIDFKFLKYVFFYNKKSRHHITDNLENISKDKVLVFKRQKDLNNWVKSLKDND